MNRERRIGQLTQARDARPSTRPSAVAAIGLSLLATCFADRALAQCKPENTLDIVQRGASTIQSDWDAFPGFAFVERDSDETSKGITIKSYRVFMIDGTDYYMPIAVDDKPYTKEQVAQEHDKLLQEIDRRSHETEKERQKRSDRYWKERNQNEKLLEEYTKAFNFTLVGEEVIDGYSACVLDAKPRLDYRPPNRAAKILTGMQGRLWIDSHDFHWLKAEAEVLKPVSILGVAVRIVPGTQMKLEMAPVSPSLWLASRFAVTVKTSIFWISSKHASVTSWSGYRPATAALADELAR
jgi:hypothetical protein